MSNTNRQVGSTLVEVLIAVSIIALVLTAVGSMISMSIRLADSNEKKQLALQKAQEAMEFFRKERLVNSWHGFTTPLVDNSTYCVSSLPASMAGMTAKLGICADSDLLEAARYRFRREATVEFSPGDNGVNLRIDMNWNDGNKAKSLSLEQGFENY